MSRIALATMAGAMALPVVLALAAVPARAELIAEQNGIDAAALFAPHGFTDVEVTRRHIDRIEAEACRGEARWHVTLKLLSSRVTAHERLGTCAAAEDSAVSRAEGGVPAPWNAEDAAMRSLEAVGYTGVQLRKWGREGWRGTACRGGWLREVRVSVQNVPAAPLRAMRECPPSRDEPRTIARTAPEPPIRHVMDVKKRLLKMGYGEIGRIEIKDGAFHAKACEKGWRFVVTMDPKGKLQRRRNIGRCGEGETVPGRVSVFVPGSDG